MNKETLQELMNSHLSIHKIAKQLGYSFTNIRYWIKKHQLKYPEICPNDHKMCPTCKKCKPIEEFYKKTANTYYSYCRDCASEQVIKRKKELKSKCVEYKGGKCSKCGYDKSHSALHFHHVDPKDKDFSISHKTITFENAKAELDKCILLCANCHAEEHDQR